MTAVSCRAKAKPFTPSSILVRPHHQLTEEGPWPKSQEAFEEGWLHELVVEAPGTAPGSERLITVAFIAIAGRIRQAKYMPGVIEIKVPGLLAFPRAK